MALNVFIFLMLLSNIVAGFESDNQFSEVVHRTLVATARSCMSATRASEADLEDLRKDPPYPEKGACIVKCLLEKMGIVHKNRYTKKGFMTIITPLVFGNKRKMEHMKAVSENCDKEIIEIASNSHNIRSTNALDENAATVLNETNLKTRMYNSLLPRTRDHWRSSSESYRCIYYSYEEKLPREQRKYCFICPKKIKRTTACICNLCGQPICLSCSKKVCRQCVTRTGD